MSDLASFPTQRSPLANGDTGLPPHIYGTRAALFYLLRETGELSAFVAPAPTHHAGLSRIQAAAPARPLTTHPLPRVVATPPDAARSARSAVRDMLQSDSFDFRGFGDPS